jgi:hypothetical protein
MRMSDEGHKRRTIAGSVSMLASVRPLGRGRLATLMLLLGLLLLALTAAARLAQPAQALNDARRSTVAEEREAARTQRREARLAQRLEKDAFTEVVKETNHAVITFTCTGIKWEYSEFPNLPGNMVTEKVTVEHVHYAPLQLTFDGSTFTNFTPFQAPPGHFVIDAGGRWEKKTANGIHGAFDVHTEAHCSATPGLSAEKLQKIAGAGGEYTTGALNGAVGQTVDYEILVHNTGNVPLTLSSVSDPGCDAGTVTGGSEGTPLAVEASTTYLCTHVLSSADQLSGSHSNTVTVTGTPPEGEGAPVSAPTNTVLVTVPPPESPTTTEEVPTTTPPGETGVAGSKTSSPTGGNTDTTTTGTTPKGGTTGSESSKSGVLAFSSATPSALKGPQGCVRRSFSASVKSVGVASVTFYLDGRMLKRLTAKNAKHGLLSVRVDPTKLEAGRHSLTARVAMALPTSPTGKPARVTRKLNVLRCRAAVLTPEFTG